MVTDIAALWTRFLTLESTSTERGVWWLLSVLSMATALPYLLFLLPTIGVILLRLELTGYDKRGTLRSVLSHRKMVREIRCGAPPSRSCSTRRRRDPLGEAALYAERGGEAARGARPGGEEALGGRGAGGLRGGHVGGATANATRR